MNLNESQDLCEVYLVQQRDARLAFVPCGAGTSVSVLYVSLSLSNKLAVAQNAH